MVLIGGAVGSAVLFLYAASRVNAPVSLRVLFTVWIVAPFAVFAVVDAASVRWSAIVQPTLVRVAAIVAAVDVVLYGVGALSASRPPTALFVLVPPVSIMFAAVLVGIALAHGPAK